MSIVLTENAKIVASKQFWALAKQNTIDIEAFETAFRDELKQLGLDTCIDWNAGKLDDNHWYEARYAANQYPDSWAAKALTKFYYVCGGKYSTGKCVGETSEQKKQKSDHEANLKLFQSEESKEFISDAIISALTAMSEYTIMQISKFGTYLPKNTTIQIFSDADSYKSSPTGSKLSNYAITKALIKEFDRNKQLDTKVFYMCFLCNFTIEVPEQMGIDYVQVWTPKWEEAISSLDKTFLQILTDYGVKNVESYTRAIETHLPDAGVAALSTGMPIPALTNNTVLYGYKKFNATCHQFLVIGWPVSLLANKDEREAYLAQVKKA